MKTNLVIFTWQFLHGHVTLVTVHECHMLVVINRCWRFSNNVELWLSADSQSFMFYKIRIFGLLQFFLETNVLAIFACTQSLHLKTCFLVYYKSHGYRTTFSHSIGTSNHKSLLVHLGFTNPQNIVCKTSILKSMLLSRLACFSHPGFYRVINTALGKNPIVGKPSKELYLKLYCNNS